MGPLRGRLVEIGGGRALRAVPAGPANAAGRPLVLLEAGSFGFSADWAAVQALLAAEGLRSLAYDRAGMGFSPPGPAPRDSRAIVDDLAALLATLGEEGPFLVVGHSMAGMHVRLFACERPEKVVGLVLIDATTPEAMDHPVAARVVGLYANFSQAAAWGAKTGVVRPLAGALGDAIGLPADAKAEKRHAFADPGHNQWSAAEVVEWAADAAQARGAGRLDPAWPVAVVLTGDGKKPMARHSLQLAPAAESHAGSVVYIAGANHASMLGERHAGEIVGAILAVEAAAAEAGASGAAAKAR